jgi:hypothetical protein
MYQASGGIARGSGQFLNCHNLINILPMMLRNVKGGEECSSPYKYYLRSINRADGIIRR